MDFYDDLKRDENGRCKSWEYCYNVFMCARTLNKPDLDYLSLHLAFYLASWGMYRGSSFLLQKDYKVHIPVVEEILKEDYNNLVRISIVPIGLVIIFKILFKSIVIKNLWMLLVFAGNRYEKILLNGMIRKVLKK